MRILILIFIVFFLANCSSKTSNSSEEGLDTFISELDGKSLEDIETELNKNTKQLEHFIKMFDKEGLFSNEIKKIAKDEEEYEPVFKFDTTPIDELISQFQDISFQQTFENHNSQIEFSLNNKDGFDNKPKQVGEGFYESYDINKIFYSNGTIKTDGLNDFQVGFSFSREMGEALPIDSILINYKLEHIISYDSITVSLDNPKMNYKNGIITLEKMDRNYAYITKSDTIAAFIEIKGINKEGKILSGIGSSSGEQSPENQKKIIEGLISSLKLIQKKLANNDFKSTEELQEYLRKKLNNVDYFKDTDGLYHKEIYSKGEIHAVRMYFENEKETKKVQFIAKNNTVFGDYTQMPITDREEVAFINKQGKIQFTVKGDGFSSLNSRYYESEKYFHHLNIEKKRMDTLLVYEIYAASNGLVGIKKEKESDNYSLFNLDNKKISANKYYKLFDNGGILFGYTDNYICMIDKSGKESVLKDIRHVYNSSEGMISVERNNGKFGFLDGRGEIAIPFIYESVNDFLLGYTAVKPVEGTYKIIDTKGKIIVDTNSKNLSISENSGKRVYRFSNNEIYNSYGKPIFKD
ncbi:MAG: WG repeat-containing protein [Flavobacteriaceae bacterium]|nr:WG repeat-containing protein [Flavobacteriaceae bacterium]